MSFQFCQGCPTNPPCAQCPNKPAPAMRVGRPVEKAVKAKRERPPLDRERTGYGKHTWEYIDPSTVPTDFGPPGGVARRDFNSAFNRPNPETDVTIDVISRPGAVIKTTAEGWDTGEWTVVKMPRFHDGTIRGFLSRALVGEEVHEVPLHVLGIVAERFSNLYDEAVVTKLVSGGKANKASRRRLTGLHPKAV